MFQPSFRRVVDEEVFEKEASLLNLMGSNAYDDKVSFSFEVFSLHTGFVILIYYLFYH